jgi:phytanoyl-CoA hydroxylase
MLRAIGLFHKLRRSVITLGRRNHHLLSRDEIARYRIDGLIIPAFRVAEPTLIQLEQALSVVLPPNGEVTPDFVPQLQRTPILAPAIVRFARTPEILDMVGQLIGNDIALWGAGLFGKPARHGKPTPWHQDAGFPEYQAIRPLQLCTVWLALDDSTPENGCVHYVSGSHRAQTVEAHVRRPNEDLTLARQLENCNWGKSAVRSVILQRGQASIHDVFLVHGSTANKSGKRRAGIALRYMPTTSYYDREFAWQSGVADRRIYLVRGIDRCGTNNLLAPAAALN